MSQEYQLRAFNPSEDRKDNKSERTNERETSSNTTISHIVAVLWQHKRVVFDHEWTQAASMFTFIITVYHTRPNLVRS
ncbi:MAG: hypothetical protein EOP45_21255 [Sphingobacteriaceae bacterium]|nr:MAG: hypothetical protein EOP45_21255 [Sphingobacteriaceae bacterium]